MEHYVGLDVSLKLTAICIVDQTGRIEREGIVASNAEAIAAFIKSHAPHVARIGLETGATSTWLWTELNKLGLPIICIDARHAKAALRMQINTSDRNVCRDDGGGEIARFFASSHQRDCACNIDPPASSYAIMRRASPYRGENPGPGEDVEGELEPRPGIREQPRPFRTFDEQFFL